jgi:hypothetical protein
MHFPKRLIVGPVCRCFGVVNERRITKAPVKHFRAKNWRVRCSGCVTADSRLWRIFAFRLARRSVGSNIPRWPRSTRDLFADTAAFPKTYRGRQPSPSSVCRPDLDCFSDSAMNVQGLKATTCS